MFGRNHDRGRAEAPITVAVVGIRGMPGIMGGIETHSEQIYPRITETKSDINVVLYARRPYMTQAEPFTYKGVRIMPLPAIRNKYVEALTHTLQAIVVARFRDAPDVIHIHGIGPGLCAPLARLLGCKVVVTHHGQDYNRDKWNWLAKAVLRFGEWVSLHSANFVIVVNRGLSETLKARFPKKSLRLMHIPNGSNHMKSSPPGSNAEVMRFGEVRSAAG